MVTITKDLVIAGDPNLIVHSAAGEYADTDLILCADKSNPSLATAQLQAQYIKYGPMVYQFNTPEELGTALFAVDPESTHDAVLLYKEEAARKAARDTGTLTPSDPVPSPDSPEPAPIPEEQEADTQFFKEEAQKEASSTPDVAEEVVPEPEIPVVEPEVVVPEPEVVIPEPELPGNISSTTPILPEEAAVDLSTTTPE